MVLEKLSRTITRRTSTFLAAVVVSTIFVEHGIFTTCDYIHETYNKGVSESVLAILYNVTIQCLILFAFLVSYVAEIVEGHRPKPQTTRINELPGRNGVAAQQNYQK